MDAQTIIARRVAQELRPGNLVNLGIGIPTLVANYVPEGLKVFFQSENGLIGTGPIPEQGMAHPLLTDAGGKPISALPGAATFDSAMSFGLIRGGHVDVTVLGGLQVDAGGPPRQLDDPRQDGAGHGRRHGPGERRQARDRRHAACREGQIQDRCQVQPAPDFVAAGRPRRDRHGGHRLSRRQGDACMETAPGVSVAEVLAVTEAELAIPDDSAGNEALTH